MTKRLFAATTVAAMLASSLVLVAGASATKPKGKADSGVAYFSIVHTVGNTEYAAGVGHDKILGNVAASYALSVAVTQSGTFQVKAKKVTIYNGSGSLTGTGSATIQNVGNTQTITGGKLSLTKGAGSLKGHSLVVTFTGTANLTANQSQFNYSGKYK
jgi:hypothetical protein